MLVFGIPTVAATMVQYSTKSWLMTEEDGPLDWKTKLASWLPLATFFSLLVLGIRIVIKL